MSDHSSKRICGFPECSRPYCCKGFCISHWRQQHENKPLRPLQMYLREPRLVYVEVPCLVPGLKGPCHQWARGKNKYGYGALHVGRKMLRSHRFAWEQAHGPIPDGLLIDHQCRNRACCNVDHLRVVTYNINNVENVVGAAWQISKAKKHCKHGHEFTVENTINRIRNGRACRDCRQCGRVRTSQYEARLKSRLGSRSAPATAKKPCGAIGE